MSLTFSRCDGNSRYGREVHNAFLEGQATAWTPRFQSLKPAICDTLTARGEGSFVRHKVRSAATVLSESAARKPLASAQ